MTQDSPTTLYPGVDTLYRGVYGTGMEHTTKGAHHMQTGDMVETTQDTTSYIKVPAGFRGRITHIGVSHATMNGGGRDLELLVEDLDMQDAIEARLRKLQPTNPEFYTDRFIASAKRFVRIRDKYVRVV